VHSQLDPLNFVQFEINYTCFVKYYEALLAQILVFELKEKKEG
jgi:hypothetical protein